MMFQLKLKPYAVILLITIFIVPCFNHVNATSVFALDIKGMANKKAEEKVEPEEVILDSNFFFDSLGKQFDTEIEYHKSVEAIPYALNNGEIFDLLGRYANYRALPGDELINIILMDSYNFFPDFPEKLWRQGRQPLPSDQFYGLYSMFSKIQEYHAIKFGFSNGSAKDVETEIQSALRDFFNSVERSHPINLKPYKLAERDKEALINFISDYDEFLKKYYAGLAKKRKTTAGKENKKEYDKIYVENNYEAIIDDFNLDAVNNYKIAGNLVPNLAGTGKYEMAAITSQWMSLIERDMAQCAINELQSQKSLQRSNYYDRTTEEMIMYSSDKQGLISLLERSRQYYYKTKTRLTGFPEACKNKLVVSSTRADEY